MKLLPKVFCFLLFNVQLFYLFCYYNLDMLEFWAVSWTKYSTWRSQWGNRAWQVLILYQPNENKYAKKKKKKTWSPSFWKCFDVVSVCVYLDVKASLVPICKQKRWLECGWLGPATCWCWVSLSGVTNCANSHWSTLMF